MTDFSRMTDHEMFWHDEQIFSRKLKEWGVEPIQYKTIVLNCGLGDHLIFAKVLPEIKAKYKHLILGVCYNEVFSDDKDIKLTSIAEANMIANPDEHNVYKLLWDNSHTLMNLEEAYRRMYLS